MRRAVRVTTLTRLDVSTDPKQLDLQLDNFDLQVAAEQLYVQGASAEELRETLKTGKMKGIYQLTGNQLTYCLAAPGKPRPTMFAAPAESGHTLVTLEPFTTGEQEVEAKLREFGFDVTKDEVGWITSLSFQGETIDGAAFDHLSKLSHLVTVYFASDSLPDHHLARLARTTDLEALELRSTSISDAGLAHISRMTSLRSLYLLDAPVTDDGLMQLAKLDKLATLRLRGTQVTDDGIKSLMSALPGLQHVGLRDTAVTDAGFRHLSALPELTGLELVGSKITDTGVAQLTALQQLKTLSLARAQITNASLPHIGKLTNLESLDLSGTRVTDAGLDSLGDLKNLEVLSLNETSVSKEAVRKLRERLPKLVGVKLKGRPRVPIDEEVKSVVESFIHAASQQDTKAVSTHIAAPWIRETEVHKEPLDDISGAGLLLPPYFRAAPKQIVILDRLEELEGILEEPIPENTRQQWMKVLTDQHRIALIKAGGLLTIWGVNRPKQIPKVRGLLSAYFPNDDDPLFKELRRRSPLNPQSSADPMRRRNNDALEPNTNRVIDAQGKPIAGAKVEVLRYTYQEDQLLAETATNKDGRFDYPGQTPKEKPFFVRLSAEGFVTERWIGNRRVHLRRAGRRVPDVLRLERVVTLRGRVVDAEGKGLAKIPLVLDFFHDRMASIDSRRFQSDAAGRFELTGLPAGELFVRYNPDEDQKKHESAEFFVAHRTARGGETVEDIVLDLSKCRCELAGQLVNERGEGVAGATVRAALAASARHLDQDVSVTTDDTGAFKFINLPPHAFEVSARTRNGGLGEQVVVQLREGHPKVLTLRTYVPGHPPPADRMAALPWGPKRDGLQAAIFVDPAAPHQSGSVFDVKIVVRNAGRESKVFHDSWRANRLHIFGPFGHELRNSMWSITGRIRWDTYRLEPGHEVVLRSSFDVQWLDANATGSDIAAFEVKHYPGKQYQLQVSLGDGGSYDQRPPDPRHQWVSNKLTIQTK